MSSAEKIRKLFAKSDITVDSKIDDRIINDALTAFDKPGKTQFVSPESNIWRIIMKSPITKLTAAAATIIAVVFSISLLDKAATPAYALEQTIEANHTIKTIHLRIFEGAESIENNEFSDYWIKYNDAGKLSNLRRNEHDKDSFVRFTVWNEGVSKTWIPENNLVIVKRLNNTAKELEDFAETFDPKLFLQWLYDQSKEEEAIEIKIDEPAEDSNSIYVKATHAIDKFRMELVVDRKTKLIKKLSTYRLREHGDELNAQIEYLAYNQPIDPSMFELSGIPDNAKVIDRVEGGIIIPGLRVGDYTLGMSEDDMLNKLGEPSGMHFVTDDGVIKEISVRSPLYKFANGLGVGDSEDKIKQAFGNDFQLEEFELKALLTYEDKGLQFKIHKQDRTVMEINVSPRPGSEAYKKAHIPASETVPEPMVSEKAHIPPTSYINEQGHIVDKVDYPFINDPQVIGTWKSVDFVDEMEQFKVGEKQWKESGGELIINEMIFEKNGRLISKYDKVKRGDPGTWTKGLVISNRNKTASRYHIKEIDGSAYMFYEWKSSDYTIRHRKPAYYVLKKVSSETGGLAKARASQPSDAEFARRLPAKIEQLDIDTADLEQVKKIFGKPIKYIWGKETFKEDNLPKQYILYYPSQFRVFMSGNKIVEIWHESGFNYVFRGKLRSGSTLDDVFEVIGYPKKIVQGEENKFKDGVLYKDIEGRKGHRYYGRYDRMSAYGS